MSNATELWDRIKDRLTIGIPQWQKRIEGLDQIPLVEARAAGRHWSDDDVFKGLILSMLSSNTDWAKIQSVLPELSSVLGNFHLSNYASLTRSDITQRVIPWFKKRRAGSPSLSKGLANMICAAHELLNLRERYGSLDRYLTELLKESEGDIISVALALGKASSTHKLPGLGIPLAAEFLKNIGFDIAKPDRHINRAVGSFGWVQFRNWRDRTDTKFPTASEPEMEQVMREMAAFASNLGELVCLVDNAVWLVCAKSGLYYSNSDLSALNGGLT